MSRIITESMDPTRYDVFLDSSCAFCRWTQEQIHGFDSGNRLRFLDYGDPAVEALTPFTRDELAAEMNVHTPDGRWLKGFAAWLAILRVLPGLAWIGWIASLPPLRWAGPSLYRFVAHHRHLLPGAPAGCESGTCSLSARRLR